MRTAPLRLNLAAPRSRPVASVAAQRLLGWLLLAMLLAMLLAPALGRIHQVMHPPAWQLTSQGQAQGAAASVECADDSAPWLQALFAGHSATDCQLHDQLNAWASPPAASPALPVALAREMPRPVPGRSASAGSAAFFDARAPPAGG